MSAAQSDLFGRPGLPGLAQAEAFVTSSQEQALIRSIGAAALSPFRFHGWSGKRLTASFWWRYDFETASLPSPTCLRRSQPTAPALRDDHCPPDPRSRL